MSRRGAYRRRNVVERCANRLKEWRTGWRRGTSSAVDDPALVIIVSLMISLTT